MFSFPDSELYDWEILAQCSHLSGYETLTHIIDNKFDGNAIAHLFKTSQLYRRVA